MRVLVLTLLALLWPGLARATSCAPPELGPSTDRADVVFVAKVTAHRDHTLFSLSTERVFKGDVPKGVQARGGGMKGASFEVGKRFLVFGKLTPDDAEAPLFAHLCGGTQLADQAKEWIAKLGPGSAPGKALARGVGPSAPPDAAPPPSAAQGPEPAPTVAPEPTVAAPPAPAPTPVAPDPPAAPAVRSGCAACALGTPWSPANGARPALALLALAAVAMAARRSMIRP